MIPQQLLQTFFGRLALTAFSLAILAGWFTATVNLYLSYEGLDGEPGLSVADVKTHFYGDRSQNRFVVALHGSMKENLFDPEADLEPLTDWALAPGLPGFDLEAHRKLYEDRVAPVLDSDCLTCHVREGKAGHVPLETYAQIEPLLQVDTGPSVMMLARFSHFHLIGMGTLALLTGLLGFAFLRARIAGILSCLALVGLLVDVGGWWATRQTGWMAPMVPLGGTMFAAGIVMTHLALLGRYWDRKAAAV